MLAARPSFCPAAGAWAAADAANSISPATRQVTRFMGGLLSTTLKPLKRCARSWHHRPVLPLPDMRNLEKVCLFNNCSNSTPVAWTRQELQLNGSVLIWLIVWLVVIASPFHAINSALAASTNPYKHVEM